MIRTLLLTLFLLVMAVDLLIVYLLAPFYKGYAHRKTVMSALGGRKSPVGLFYNAWLVLGGVLFLMGAWAFVSELGGSLNWQILILLWVFGLGAMVLGGLFPVGETKQMNTLGEKLHGYGSGIGFMALLFVPLCLALHMRGEGNSGTAGLFAACFLLAVLFFTLFIMADKKKFQPTFISQEGLWQRLTLLFCYLPPGILIVKQL